MTAFINAEVKAKVTPAPGHDGNGVDVMLRATNKRSLVVAQFEAPGFEISKANKRFHFGSGVLANAVAPLQEMPTTASMYALQNQYSADSRIHLVIDQVSVFLFSGTGAVGGAVLIAGIPASPHASALSNGTGVVGPKSNTGSTARTSQAVWAAAPTLASTPAWISVGFGPAIPASNVFPCPAITAEFQNFPLVIRPGNYYAAFHVLAGAGTGAEYSMSCIYHEVEAELGT